MKNLYRKGKVQVQVQVQVHPSPSHTPACRDAYSVLRLLPVAIAALSASLQAEDREVLAYFIARSLDVPDKETKKNNKRGGGGGATPRRGAIADEEDGFPPWAAGGGAAASSSSSFTRFAETDVLLQRSPSSSCRGKEAKNNRKAATPSQRSHRASFECSCFQCYTSFWSRWDASPRREIIHQAIDLFEEHIAALAAEAEVTKARKSRKGLKPGKDDKNTKVVQVKEKEQEKEKEKDEVFAALERDEDSKPAPRSKQIVPMDFEEENEEDNKGEEVRAGACPLEGRSLMRRMFPDIMGFVADHLWTAWSSPVRASNA